MCFTLTDKINQIREHHKSYEKFFFFFYSLLKTGEIINKTPADIVLRIDNETDLETYQSAAENIDEILSFLTISSQTKKTAQFADILKELLTYYKREIQRNFEEIKEDEIDEDTSRNVAQMIVNTVQKKLYENVLLPCVRGQNNQHEPEIASLYRESLQKIRAYFAQIKLQCYQVKLGDLYQEHKNALNVLGSKIPPEPNKAWTIIDIDQDPYYIKYIGENGKCGIAYVKAPCYIFGKYERRI